MRAYRVTLNRKHIDTVFYTPSKGETVKEAEENTRTSLINHDGYDPGIVVRQERNQAIAPNRPSLPANLS